MSIPCLLRVLSIIPARGGSKGIPRKNIVDLAEKPLITYTIEVALNSERIEKIVVSTEDNEIANISKKYKRVEVLKRPVELAKDDTSTMDVLFNVFKQLEKENKNSTLVILLQPISPLRIAKDIDEAIDKFQKSDGDSLVSVYEAINPPQWSLKIENGYLQALFNEKYFYINRQNLKKAYKPNGAIFNANYETLKINRSYYNCKKIIPYIMSSEKSIDIDDEFDLELAKFLIKNKK